MNNVTPSMASKKQQPISIFPLNDTYVIAVYQGSLSKFDILIKYRQKIDGKWSRIRTPKHIHWAVDVLIKLHFEFNATKEFIDSLIYSWENLIHPLKSKEEREEFLDCKRLLTEVEEKAKDYELIAQKGEYSIKFLILLAQLLMVQEKTNYNQAYKFNELLNALKDYKNIFGIIQKATQRRK